MEKTEKEKIVKEIKQTAPANLPVMEEEDKLPASRIVWRVLILGAVLIVLVIVSIGIIKLVPRAISSLASVNVSISSLFTPSKSATSTASNSNNNNVTYSPVTANNNVAPGSATTSAPYNVNNGNTGNYNYANTTSGTPDLQLTITSIGTLDRNTGVFVPTNNVNTNDRVAVKFQVENIGSGPSGAWNLSAALPAVNPSDQTKNLSNQVSIPAGMAVSGELYFDYVETGQNRVVQISISDSRGELSTANNSAEVTINATGNNYYGGNGYYNGVTANGVDLAVQVLGNTGGNTVQFQVTNQGNVPSGTWTYTANLANNYVYNNYNNSNCSYSYGSYQCNNGGYNNNQISQSEPSLAPGQSAVLTTTFPGLQYGTNNSVNIVIDPNDQIPDTNRSNNYATANLYVNSY